MLDYAARQTLTYYERRFEGVRTFEITDGRLHIRGSLSFRSPFALSFDLATIDPKYIVARVRPPIFFVAVFLFNTCIAVVAMTGRLQATSQGFLFAASLMVLLMVVTFRKQTFYRFHHLSGGLAFDIGLVGPQKHRAEDFAHSVAAAAHLAKAGTGSPGPPSAPVGVPLSVTATPPQLAAPNTASPSGDADRPLRKADNGG